VAALRNTRGLTWPTSFEQQKQKAGELDLLDWLRAMFGFQVGLPTKGIKLACIFLIIAYQFIITSIISVYIVLGFSIHR
jgi:hypothetical protein